MGEMRTTDARDATPGADKPARSRERRRMLKAGMISYGGHCATLPCTVRDLSETGARLTADTPSGVPDTFRLTIELDGIEVQCEVVWRRSGQVGVRFISAPRAIEPRRRQIVSGLGTTSRPSLRRHPR